MLTVALLAQIRRTRTPLAPTIELSMVVAVVALYSQARESAMMLAEIISTDLPAAEVYHVFITAAPAVLTAPEVMPPAKVAPAPSVVALMVMPDESANTEAAAESTVSA